MAGFHSNREGRRGGGGVVQLSCPWVGSSVREGSHPGRALESESRGGGGGG